ncbi:cytosolic prostaglandin E synthase [Brevipalpus obovatus]|uniref:cytosolic prostaglandin E synthase n=1 Tax=Brevipalpus obovatus TaxID=246614 RepID=UPI003D9E0325
MTSEKPVSPLVYWAQHKDVVFVRIAIEDCKEPTVKIDKQSLHFSGKGGDGRYYESDMKLFGEIDPDHSKHTLHGRGLEFELVKADDKAPFWKKLLSGDVKPHWLKIDFNKWKDEEDSEDEGAGAGAGPGGFPGGPGGSMGGFEEIMKQMGGFDQGNMGDMGGDMEGDEKDSDDEPLPDLED